MTARLCARSATNSPVLRKRRRAPLPESTGGFRFQHVEGWYCRPNRYAPPGSRPSRSAHGDKLFDRFYGGVYREFHVQRCWDVISPPVREIGPSRRRRNECGRASRTMLSIARQARTTHFDRIVLSADAHYRRSRRIQVWMMLGNRRCPHRRSLLNTTNWPPSASTSQVRHHHDRSHRIDLFRLEVQ